MHHSEPTDFSHIPAFPLTTARLNGFPRTGSSGHNDAIVHKLLENSPERGWKPCCTSRQLLGGMEKRGRVKRDGTTMSGDCRGENLFLKAGSIFVEGLSVAAHVDIVMSLSHESHMESGLRNLFLTTFKQV